MSFFLTVVIKGFLDDTEPAVPTGYLDFSTIFRPYF